MSLIFATNNEKVLKRIHSVRLFEISMMLVFCCDESMNNHFFFSSLLYEMNEKYERKRMVQKNNNVKYARTHSTKTKIRNSFEGIERQTELTNKYTLKEKKRTHTHIDADKDKAHMQ